MSVLARKRKQSPMEFYANAKKMRKSIVFLLLRDLGIKDKVRNLAMTTKQMNEEDADKFKEIAQKYGMASFISEYPEWIIDKLRTSIWDILRDMNIQITRAYSIWATNISEAYERRLCMDRAISDCESILQELQLAIDILPIDAEKYMRYVDVIEREIALLKGWRKSDNKRIKELQEEAYRVQAKRYAVASASNFANANNNGNANNNNASNTDGGVRPLLIDGERLECRAVTTGNELASVHK